MLIAWHTVLQPLFNSLTFKLEECGIHINFGVARSMGSLAYSALVAVLGTLVENHGIVVLPITGEVVLVMLIISLIATKKQYDKAKRLQESQNECDSMGESDEKTIHENPTEEINLVQFIKRNKAFFVLNLGVIGLYFSNSILNNYMMQIVASVGGNSEDMGRILSLMAFLEIPTMVCFDWLKKNSHASLCSKRQL